MRPETFGSRTGMMLAMLGMAVGTGNIWRFPRIAGQNGGGEFLVAWFVFLFLWSIPLILLEFGLGRKFRRGPVRAFVGLAGPRCAWMGAFLVVVTTGILCYYSVVAGWTVHYVGLAVRGVLPESVPGSAWSTYTASRMPLVTHAIVIGGACLVVARGVRSIERVAKILMPALLVLVLVLTVRALFLPGAGDGLSFLFSVDVSRLAEPRIWIEALTQNAWDTGAGWGLVLCYAAYLPEREDTAQNAFILPAANNAISLCAGVMVLCTLFSIVPGLAAELGANPAALANYPGLEQAIEAGRPLSTDLVREEVIRQDNVGLTFVWMPQLFGRMPFGRPAMIFFFLALAFAAFTSLVSMIELATRSLTDLGLTRQRSVSCVAIGAFLIGMPSALYMPFLENQDFVWAVALMPTGLFLAVGVWRYGLRRFREEQLNHANSKMHIGRWWDVTIGFLVPLQALVLFGWWLYQSWGYDQESPFDPFRRYSIGTVVLQISVACGLLLGANRWLARRSQER